MERQLYHFRTGDKVVAFDGNEEYCPIPTGIWVVTKTTRVFDVCDCGLGHGLDGRHQQGCSSLLGESSASRHPQYITVELEGSDKPTSKEISGWWARPAEGETIRLLEPLTNWCAPKAEPFQIFEKGRTVSIRDADAGDILKSAHVTSTFRVADICTCRHIHLGLDQAKGLGIDEPHDPKCGMRLGMRLNGHPQYVTLAETGESVCSGSQLIYVDSPNPPTKK